MNWKPYTIAICLSLWTPIAHADPEGNWGRGYGHMSWGSGYGIFGGLMTLIFWGVIIALIFFAVRWFSDNKTPTRASEALDILRERFAKGEIDEDEFKKRKSALED